MFECRKYPVKLKYRIIIKLVSFFVLYQNTYQLKSERLYIFFFQSRINTGKMHL